MLAPAAALLLLAPSYSDATAKQTITIDAGRVINTVDTNFLGVNIDTQLLATNATQRFITDPAIRALSAPFAGSVLRVGGSSDNHWRFVLPNGTVPGAKSSVPDEKAWLLKADMWDKLYDYAKSTGMKLVFQLNALGCRRKDRSWDPTNTIAFLRHLHSQGQDKEGVIAGFEFANEPFLFDAHDKQPYITLAAELAAAYKQLRAIMAEELDAGLTLQGPDSCCAPLDTRFFHEFVSRARPYLDQVSVHFYPYSQCHDPCTIDNYLSVEKFAKEFDGLENYRDWMAEINGKDPNALPLVLSETAGASCGGCANITNAYSGSLWWATYMGVVSTIGGYRQLYRQALIGVSSYALVNTYQKRTVVNPDYYVSLLWRRLMGSTFMQVSLEPQNDYLHVFAACGRKGTDEKARARKAGLVVAFSNWSPAPVNVTLDVKGIAGQPLAGLTRQEYILTSDGLQSKNLRLNGAKRWLTAAKQLVPKEVVGLGQAMAVPGYSLGFVVMPGMRAPVCTGA
jgi:hypothetical protein